MPSSSRLLVLGLSLGLQTALAQIPAPRILTETESVFLLPPNVQITVDSAYEDILSSYAQTFRSDLISVTGFTDIPEIVFDDLSDQSGILLGLNATSDHALFNGQPTGEGYDFEITADYYLIRGEESIGAWWGTRTLLQQVALASRDAQGSISLPTGSGSDSPGWEVRGFMLDAGRHWFQPSFLADLCIYASFFKLQTLHIHASDNLWNPAFLYNGGDWRSLYSGFRFQPSEDSSNAGLVPLRNESWSREEFEGIQETCSKHGVTVIPEIDTPAHSLIFSQWKEQLMIEGKPDQLNLTHPDTIPTIKAVWDEFLPWFPASEVSIGADEYDRSFADDYISFVNEMSEHISAQSGKSIRVWGTNETSETLTISTNVTIQHWNSGDTAPVQLLEQGYKVINSEQYFLYTVGKTSDLFPPVLDPSRIWRGGPDGSGWAPNVFEKASTSIDHPLLRGSIMALWNDWGNNATTPLEIYYQLSKSLAMFAEKAWGGNLTEDQFEDMYPTLNGAAPGQNLNRVVDAKGVVFEYATVDEHTQTSFDSVGPPYTLKFSVKPQSTISPSVFFPSVFYPAAGVIFSGIDSKLHVESLTFQDSATRKFYPLDYTLPTDTYTVVEIHATREHTYALIDGSEERRYWTTSLDFWGERMQEANMSFAAPSLIIRGQGFVGDLKNVSLRLGA